VLRVEFDPRGGPDSRPVTDAASLVDALAGRGDVADVVDAPDEVLDALAMSGSYIHG
jgi:hypothetical protein